MSEHVTEPDPRDMRDTFDMRDLSTYPPLYVVVDGGEEYLVMWDTRCTATTVRGARCRNPVLGGEDRFRWPSGDNAERDPLVFEKAEATERATTLLCQRSRPQADQEGGGGVACRAAPVTTWVTRVGVPERPSIDLTSVSSIDLTIVLTRANIAA
jgi:hypothetical protein